MTKSIRELFCLWWPFGWNTGVALLIVFEMRTWIIWSGTRILISRSIFISTLQLKWSNMNKTTTQFFIPIVTYCIFSLVEITIRVLLVFSAFTSCSVGNWIFTNWAFGRYRGARDDITSVGGVVTNVARLNRHNGPYGYQRGRAIRDASRLDLWLILPFILITKFINSEQNWSELWNSGIHDRLRFQRNRFRFSALDWLERWNTELGTSAFIHLDYCNLHSSELWIRMCPLCIFWHFAIRINSETGHNIHVELAPFSVINRKKKPKKIKIIVQNVSFYLIHKYVFLSGKKSSIYNIRKHIYTLKSESNHISCYNWSHSS